MTRTQLGRYVPWGLVVLGLVAGLVVLARHASQASEAVELQPSAVVSSADGLTMRVTLGAQTLPVGTPVPLWLTVANEGERPRRGITLQTLHLDGMVAVGPCWEWVGGMPSHPLCLADAPTAAVRRWPLELEAKTQVTFWASVVALGSGTANFATTLQAPEDTSGGGPVILRLKGPAVRATGGWFAPDHVQALLVLFGDLALPVALAILGFFLKRSSEADARRHEVWRQMLPRVHENAQRYYMPVSGAICAFRRRFDTLVQVRRQLAHEASDDARKALAQTGADLEKRLFYHLVMVFVRMGALLRDIGGYYFQSESGEWMAHHLWHVFRERCYQGDLKRYADFEYLADQLAAEESIATFNARLAAPQPATPTATSPPRWAARLAADLAPLFHGPPVDLSDQQALREALTRIREWFASWLEQELADENDLYLLRILEDVFDYEMNMPYRVWYGKSLEPSKVKKERFDNLKACGPRLLALAAHGDGEDAFKELYVHAKTYFGEEILKRTPR